MLEAKKQISLAWVVVVVVVQGTVMGLKEVQDSSMIHHRSSPGVSHW